MRLRSFSPSQLIVVGEESGKGLVAASADLQSPNLEHDIGNYVYNIRAKVPHCSPGIYGPGTYYPRTAQSKCQGAEHEVHPSTLTQ